MMLRECGASQTTRSSENRFPSLLGVEDMLFGIMR